MVSSIAIYQSHFNIIDLLAHIVCSIWSISILFDPIRCYHSKSNWTMEQWQWKVQHIPQISKAGASLANGLMSWHSLVGAVLSFCRDVVHVINSSSRVDCELFVYFSSEYFRILHTLLYFVFPSIEIKSRLKQRSNILMLQGKRMTNQAKDNKILNSFLLFFIYE